MDQSDTRQVPMLDPRPVRWRERAEELRTTAETMKSPEASEMMRDTATQWEKMADGLDRASQIDLILGNPSL